MFLIKFINIFYFILNFQYFLFTVLFHKVHIRLNLNNLSNALNNLIFSFFLINRIFNLTSINLHIISFFEFQSFLLCQAYHHNLSLFFNKLLDNIIFLIILIYKASRYSYLTWKFHS